MVVDQYGNPFDVGDYVLIADILFGFPYFATISVVKVEKIEWSEYWKEHYIYYERQYPIKRRGELLSRRAKECVVTTESNYLVQKKQNEEWEKKKVEKNERRD